MSLLFCDFTDLNIDAISKTGIKLCQNEKKHIFAPQKHSNQSICDVGKMASHSFVTRHCEAVHRHDHNYYPYGGVIGVISTNESVQKYKFEGPRSHQKEIDNLLARRRAFRRGVELDRTFGLDNYDIHARQYFAMAPSWDRIDPLAEEHLQFSPYSYCMGDPVNFGDYDGCDTTVVNFMEGNWVISTPIISEGDDVFIIKDGDNETILTNTEGEYGNRMNIVYLESDEFQNFGIYQLSGTKTCGYVLQPPGAPSSNPDERHRSISGTYQTGLGTGKRWPNYVSVNNDQLYHGKGKRVHYGGSAKASTNCILISDSYKKIVKEELSLI